MTVVPGEYALFALLAVPTFISACFALVFALDGWVRRRLGRPLRGRAPGLGLARLTLQWGSALWMDLYGTRFRFDGGQVDTVREWIVV